MTVKKIKIKAYKSLPLDALTIGKGQVRVSDVGKGIDELATSIDTLGQLEPIVVCESEKAGKYEIIAGQRRYLAIKQLKWPTIEAGILSERPDLTTAKALSMVENLVREDPKRKDYIDACMELYLVYGSAKAVSEKLGIKYDTVRSFLKFHQLPPELKDLVKSGAVKLQGAVKAVDAAEMAGVTDIAEVIRIAKELSPMTGAQQRHVMKKLKDDDSSNLDDVMEAAKTGEKVVQIIVTLAPDIHDSLKAYADEEGCSLDAAAHALIEEGLDKKGLVD